MLVTPVAEVARWQQSQLIVGQRADRRGRRE